MRLIVALLRRIIALKAGEVEPGERFVDFRAILLQPLFYRAKQNHQPRGDKPIDFARMIAKIAFSMAVAVGALVEISNRHAPVLPAILGKANDIGRWVGTITDPISRHEGHLHRVLIRRDEEKGLLLGDVQLFSDSETPRYGVILGELRK
jgi:hypothetical protein